MFGEKIKRVEDPALLGKGRYLDDIHLPNMLYTAFVRSPLPMQKLLNKRNGSACSR